jgi:hypothetical protein
VIWNERNKSLGSFAEQYERLLGTYGTDYARIAGTYPESRRMSELFGIGGFQHRVFPNGQTMDFAALRGRLLSSSYAPAAEHPNHEPMMAQLRRIFDQHAEKGLVRFAYDTHVYYGRLK